MSVPNQYISEGARRRLIGDTASGSTVPSHGASSAAATMASRMTPPTIAVGWRRKASRNRFQVGETDLATGTEAASVAFTSVGNRPDQPPGGSERSGRGGMSSSSARADRTAHKTDPPRD